MSRIVTAVLLTVGMVAAVSVSAQGSGSRPHYDTPASVAAFTMDDTFGEAAWKTVKYADYYAVYVSKSKTMANPSWTVTYWPEATAMDLRGLTPDTTYYVTVRVVSSRGESLSSASVPVKFHTDATH